MSSIQELSCADFVELIGNYVEGDLDPARRDAFELHEASCAGCLRYHAQLRATRELVAAQWRRPVEEPALRRVPAVAPGERVEAFKFLRNGAVDPFSPFRWPEGEWVGAAEPLPAHVNAVHACLKEDLPFWLNEELWRFKLGGPVQKHEHKLAGASGQLGERVGKWNERMARRFAEWCADEVTRFAVDLEPAPRQECDEVREYFLSFDDFAAAPACAGLASFLAGHLDGEAGQAKERTDQADWLVRELDLDSPR